MVVFNEFATRGTWNIIAMVTRKNLPRQPFIIHLGSPLPSLYLNLVRLQYLLPGMESFPKSYTFSTSSGFTKDCGSCNGVERV